MSDIVERLRSGRRVTQFNSAGVLETYNAAPDPIDLEAAAEILRLRSALEAEQWMPIDEDTPKKKPLLVWHPGLGMGGWNVMTFDGHEWRETANGGRALKDGYEPSHWRPLPLPPSPQEGGGTS